MDHKLSEIRSFTRRCQFLFCLSQVLFRNLLLKNKRLIRVLRTCVSDHVRIQTLFMIKKYMGLKSLLQMVDGPKSSKAQNFSNSYLDDLILLDNSFCLFFYSFYLLPIF